MEGSVASVHFKSESVEWGTPDEVFKPLDEEFGFLVDVCATPGMEKCSTFFSPEQDGLTKNWSLFRVCWCNPPYKRGEQAKWIAKAAEEAERGCTTVMLIPARTDTAAWHKYVQPVLEKHGTKRVRFLKGRVRFVRPDGSRLASAPFPSVVVVFAPT